MEVCCRYGAIALDTSGVYCEVIPTLHDPKNLGWAKDSLLMLLRGKDTSRISPLWWRGPSRASQPLSGDMTRLGGLRAAGPVLCNGAVPLHMPAQCQFALYIHHHDLSLYIPLVCLVILPVLSSSRITVVFSPFELPKPCSPTTAKKTENQSNKTTLYLTLTHHFQQHFTLRVGDGALIYLSANVGNVEVLPRRQHSCNRPK